MKILVGLLFIPIVALAQSALSSVVFSTPAQTIAVGAVSEQITIEARDSNGNAINGNTVCIRINSSSATGEFSSNGTAWGEQPVRMLALTLSTNQYRRNFYYRDATNGTHALTLRAALKPSDKTCPSWPIAEWPTGWTATQQITIDLGADIAEAPAASLSSPESHSGPVNVGTDPVPSLLVKISGPSVTTAGADATFSAHIFGVKKELIPNARVLWSFGNGAIREGISVRFAYNIPGSYLVSVDAASGGLAGTARLVVKALEPAIRVSQVMPGPEGFVEIENGSGVELEVSGWSIASGATHFTLPEHTFVLPRARVAFPASITGVFVVGNDARILFPNGKVAAEYVAPEPMPSAPFPRGSAERSEEKGWVPAETKPPLPPSQARGTPPYPASSAGRQGGEEEKAAISLSLSDEQRAGGLGQWLWGVVGIGVLGVGALAAFRLKPVVPQVGNKEKTFAKEVRIV